MLNREGAAMLRLRRCEGACSLALELERKTAAGLSFWQDQKSTSERRSQRKHEVDEECFVDPSPGTTSDLNGLTTLGRPTSATISPPAGQCRRAGNYWQNTKKKRMARCGYRGTRQRKLQSSGRRRRAVSNKNNWGLRGGAGLNESTTTELRRGGRDGSWIAGVGSGLGWLLGGGNLNVL